MHTSSENDRQRLQGVVKPVISHAAVTLSLQHLHHHHITPHSLFHHTTTILETHYCTKLLHYITHSLFYHTNTPHHNTLIIPSYKHDNATLPQPTRLSYTLPNYYTLIIPRHCHITPQSSLYHTTTKHYNYTPLSPPHHQQQKTLHSLLITPTPYNHLVIAHIHFSSILIIQHSNHFITPIASSLHTRISLLHSNILITPHYKNKPTSVLQ